MTAMSLQERNQQYYQEHRDEIIAKVKKWKRDNREKSRQQARKFYRENTEKCLANSHYQQRRTIKHNGVAIIRNVNKPPKPLLCTMCGNYGHLVFHHWQDDKPEIGLWVCNCCHSKIHKLIKAEVIKKSVSSQKLIINGMVPELL